MMLCCHIVVCTCSFSHELVTIVLKLEPDRAGGIDLYRFCHVAVALSSASPYTHTCVNNSRSLSTNQASLPSFLYSVCKVPLLQDRTASVCKVCLLDNLSFLRAISHIWIGVAWMLCFAVLFLHVLRQNS